MGLNTYGIYIIRTTKYNVYKKKNYLYVGIDKHIAIDQRLKQHLHFQRYNRSEINQFLQNNEFWIYEKYELHLSRYNARVLEKHLIKMYKPILNIHHNKTD